MVGPFLERAFGGVDGAPDIVDRSFGNAVDDFPGGRVLDRRWFVRFPSRLTRWRLAFSPYGILLDLCQNLREKSCS